MRTILIILFLYSTASAQTITQSRVINLIPDLAKKMAITDSSTIYQSKYRSDSGRINTYTAIAGKGTVTSVARTNGLGITASVANPTTTPNITIAVDTSDASILSRPRAAATYAPIAINGTVTTVSVTTANGVSGSVATATTTPEITLTLGAITPTTVNGNTLTTGSSTYTGTAAMTYTFPDTSALVATIPKSATVTGTDDTTTLTVILPAGGLAVWGRANKKYRVTATLLIGCDNTGGISVGVGGPAGAAVVGGQVIGISAAATATHAQRLGSINNVVGTAYNRFVNATGSVSIIGYVTTAGTAGAITIVFKSATLGNKTTIFIGSTMDLQEVQ